MVDQNSALILEREKEVNHIVQSIADLNEIFRDLATMVVEQVIITVCVYCVCGWVRKRCGQLGYRDASSSKAWICIRLMESCYAACRNI